MWHGLRALTVVVGMLGPSLALAVPVTFTFTGTVLGEAIDGYLTIDDAGQPGAIFDNLATEYRGSSTPYGMVVNFRGATTKFDSVSIIVQDDAPADWQYADLVWIQAWDTEMRHGNSFSAFFADYDGNAISSEQLMPDFFAFDQKCAEAIEGCSLALNGTFHTFDEFDWIFVRSNSVVPVTPVPEPSTLSLLGLGLAGLGFARRRKAA